MIITKIEEVFMLVVTFCLLCFVFHYLFCDFKQAIFEIFKEESCNKPHKKRRKKTCTSKKSQTNLKRRKRYND